MINLIDNLNPKSLYNLHRNIAYNFLKEVYPKIMKNINKTSIFLFIIFVICFVNLSYQSTANPVSINSNSNIAYIYNSKDDGTALYYQEFLENNSYAVDLINVSDITTTNFENYGLIIIDPESGDQGSNWGDSNTVNSIDNSNKPILGIGENGGYAFFGELGLSIGYPNGLTSSGDSIFIPDNSSSIFNEPYAISNGTIQVYSSSVVEKRIHIDSPPSNLTILTLSSQGSDYSSVLKEGNDYIYWGFEKSPNHMTEVGKKIFLNLVYDLYISQGNGAIPGYGLFIILSTLGISIPIICVIRYKKIES
jgi:hypothetical protein